MLFAPLNQQNERHRHRTYIIASSIVRCEPVLSKNYIFVGHYTNAMKVEPRQNLNHSLLLLRKQHFSENSDNKLPYS